MTLSRGTDVATAAAMLRRGGLVAFPTETVYGLGADATQPAAVARIFAVKGRPAAHPLIVHLAPDARLDDWAAEVPDDARALAAAFWPGPLTIIVRRGDRIAPEATGGADTVGLRVPSHPLAIAMLSAAGVPVAAPSANRFGRVSPTTADHVALDLGDDVDYLLDGGACEVGVESTIVDVSGGAPSLLRPGGVAKAAIERVLGRPLVAPSAAVAAPGTLASHYATRARVIAVAPDQLGAMARAAGTAAAAAPSGSVTRGGSRVAVLAPAAVLARAGLPPELPRLALPDEPRDAARALYAALRDLDARGVDTIVAALPDSADVDDGIGVAIADRLRRAAGPREDGT